jgi:ABC-type sugar transport system permease subunit
MDRAGELLSLTVSLMTKADVLTLGFALFMLVSFFSGAWIRLSRETALTGWQLMTASGEAAALQTVALPVFIQLVLAIIPLAGVGAIAALAFGMWQPAQRGRVPLIISLCGIAAMGACAVYLLDRTTTESLNRLFHSGYWLTLLWALCLAVQIFFRRQVQPTLRSRWLVLGAVLVLNALIYALTLYAQVVRSRQGESVAFEITALITVALYGAALGAFVTGSIYRRRGYSAWRGRGIGLIVGMFGHLILLVPLWVYTPPHPRQSSQTKERVKIDEISWGMVMLAPWLLAFILLTLFPMLDSYRVALYNWQGIGQPTQFVGLRHVENVIKDPYFWQSFRNSVIYTAVLVPIQLSLALGLALILTRKNMRFAIFYRTLYFLPAVTSVAVVAIIVRLIMGNFGTSVSALLGMNPPINPITSPQFSLYSVILFGMWHSFGVNLIYFMAALQTVPQDLYDAAEVDGANWWGRLFHVTLPCIRPVSIIIVFMALIGSMYVFEQSFVLTGGGPFFSSQVVTQYIYNYAFRQPALRITPNYGFASSAALFFAMIMLVLTIANYFVLSRMRKESET